MPRPPIAVFDLDGTLAETAPDLISTLNVIMAEEGLPPVAFSDARDMIGAGARALVERGFEAGHRELTPAHSDELFRRFLAVYGERLCVDSYLFPHVEEALTTLSERGYLLAVCTNKIESHSRTLLGLLGIADRFAAICGRDTFPWYKPDPRHLTLTIEAAGGDPERAVMVGDSKTDIDTAKAAGVPVVAVPFGYADRPLAEMAPDVVIQSFAELPGAVSRLPGHQSGGRDRD
jgi:phosphoglycolate phosphatase